MYAYPHRFTLTACVIGLLCLSGPGHADDSTTTEPRSSEVPKDPPRASHLEHSPAVDELREQLQDIWSGANLRRGTTAVFVVDADTGEELYRVHANDPLNPASNVKLVSTATVLANLGPDWTYKTRVLGGEPDSEGTVRGGLYLHGSYDPTLGPGAMEDLARSLFEQGVRTIEGDIVISDSLRRDTLGMTRVKIVVRGSAPGRSPKVAVWPKTDFVQIEGNKVRSRKRGRSRVRLRSRLEEEEGKAPVLRVTLRGRIRRGRKRVVYAKVRRRSSFTASVLAKALEEAGIQVTGTTRIASFAEFNAEASRAGRIPFPLAVHHSRPISNLVTRVNKRSLNHLSDRLVMTAAWAKTGGDFSMESAVELMKSWLTSIGVDSESVVLDTGSGLSYQTELSTRQIVKVLRAAGGYGAARPVDSSNQTFRDSLAIGGIDGTLRRRFRTQGVTLNSEMHGKTGTLTSVIALSGFLTSEEGRSLCFSIVTNGHRNRRKRTVRREHEHMVASLDDYLERVAAKDDVNEDDVNEGDVNEGGVNEDGLNEAAAKEVPDPEAQPAATSSTSPPGSASPPLGSSARRRAEP